MAVKVLIFGTDDLYPQLMSFYNHAVYQGLFEIAGYAIFDGDNFKIFDKQVGGQEIENISFTYAIISSQQNFYRRLKLLESRNIPRQNIIDGRVFQIPNFSFNSFWRFSCNALIFV